MSKGSAPRPFEVDHETYSKNFDAIFGKKTPPPQPIEPKKEEENERPV
jgi:hypothetical protein